MNAAAKVARAEMRGKGILPLPSLAGTPPRASRVPQQERYVAEDVMLRDGPAGGD